MVVIAAFKYFLLTVRHKWAVLKAGLGLGVPFFQLLAHDRSKLRVRSLISYGRQFFGDKSDPSGFIGIWLEHQNENKHHWEYWIPRTGHNRCEPPYPDNEPIEMPEKYVREMVADWLGASEVYEGKRVDVNNWTWFLTNYSKMRLHSKTVNCLRSILGDLGMDLLVFDELERERLVAHGVGVRYGEMAARVIGNLDSEKKVLSALSMYRRAIGRKRKSHDGFRL